MKISFLIMTMFLFLTSCQKPIPRAPIIRKSVAKVEPSIAINTKIKNRQKALFKEIIKKDSLSTYFSSKYGFWYKFDKKGNANYTPKKGDYIKYSISVFDINNHVIYAKQQQEYWVDKQDIIEGLEVGLKLMKLNDEVTFLLPSNVAYGFSGDQKKIAVNQPLIIKVKLSKINKNESN